MARTIVALTVVDLVGLTLDVIRGRSLELVDERGQVRARFNVEANGEVVLRLPDQQGTIRVKLGAAKDGSGLLLANDTAEPGIHLLADARGSSVRVANKGWAQAAHRPVAPGGGMASTTSGRQTASAIGLGNREAT